MKKSIILLFVTFAIFGCVAKKPKGFVYIFENKYTGLDTLINIGGYYTFTTSCEDRSTQHSMLMFYPNDLLIIANTDIPKELSFCFAKDDRSVICQYPSWGTYRIIGDTIKTQTIVNYGDLYGNLVYFRDYEILETKKIVNISSYCDSKKDKGCDGYKENPCPNIAKFYPLESKRDYNKCPWLKKKWFYKKNK